MTFRGKTVVVTGGASGIGAAVLAQFEALGARAFCIDTSQGASDRSFTCDVSDADALHAVVAKIEQSAGPIDICVSNAGVLSTQADPLGDPTDWQRCWNVNVLGHVHAARAVVPGMVTRGAGCFVIVASAAGLLNQIGDAPYSASKHAAVSFADSLAITYHGTGVHISLVCPQYVATPLLGLSTDDAHGSLLSAEEVAECLIEAIKAERFLVLPHPQVRAYAQSRASDHDAWIKGMAKLRQRALDKTGSAGPTHLYKLI